MSYAISIACSGSTTAEGQDTVTTTSDYGSGSDQMTQTYQGTAAIVFAFASMPLHYDAGKGWSFQAARIVVEGA